MRLTHLLSAAITLFTIICLFLSILCSFFIPCVALGEVAVYFLNRSFLHAAIHTGGVNFACAAFILLQGHYFIAMLGALIVTVEASLKGIQRGLFYEQFQRYWQHLKAR
jgi:hypothetical protein